MKTGNRLWVKASGFALSDITEEGFAIIDRDKLKLISTKTYSEDPFEREREIKYDLTEANITLERRPSVETSLHDLIPGRFVVHLHPTLVNGLMCGNDAGARVEALFGNRALFVAYTDPGYILFKAIEKQLADFRTSQGKDPEVIFLQNHGIFVGAETTEKIRSIYEGVFTAIETEVKGQIPSGEHTLPSGIEEILPAIRMMLSGESLKTLRLRNNELVQHFTASGNMYEKISRPFTPDIIVYCKSGYIYSEASDSPEALLKDIEE